VAKTASPGTVSVPAANDSFRASAKPDAFDARDLEYRPRLQPLEPRLDRRPEDRSHYYVMTQQGESCTGHALAAMINNVLAQRGTAVRVSPYMLYAMARRYDEFAGEADAGSSLRGALKGWYYHGVLPEDRWPTLEPTSAPDVDDPATAALAMTEPLGAFYRVNAFRLDDMQSAVTELHAIVASAAVHDGWLSPNVVTRESPGSQEPERMAVIERPPDAQPIGGHAFAIVGYNDVGFLVQNSWGPQWGRGGFATLPYDDWLASAYDAWVARPGVPSIVSPRSRSRTRTTTTGEVAEGPGPDLVRLGRHVVNLGNDGKLSDSGRFSSSPAQVERIFARMRDYHDWWAANPPGPRAGTRTRRIAIYAHGGLNSEKTGLTIAWNQLNWWLNNRVYPITFAWQSGGLEVLLDKLSDLLHPHLPAFGIGFDMTEQLDRLVERVARGNLRWMWDEMKKNASAASAPYAKSKAKWPPPAGGDALRAMAGLPGASLTVSRLAKYIAESPEPVEIHLVGHSAGSIFLGAMLERMAGMDIASMSYLAPAIRTDTFLEQVVPHLGGHVGAFATFGLDDRRELDDVCAARGHTIYHKSLLYLVSRALERPTGDSSEVPLLGMQRYADTNVGGTTTRAAVSAAGGTMVWSPSERPVNSRTDSTSHGGFDDNVATMTSVMLRVLGSSQLTDVATYQARAQRREPEPDASAGTEVSSPNATVAALQRVGWRTAPQQRAAARRSTRSTRTSTPSKSSAPSKSSTPSKSSAPSTSSRTKRR
jgi:hypothetical protein